MAGLVTTRALKGLGTLLPMIQALWNVRIDMKCYRLFANHDVMTMAGNAGSLLHSIECKRVPA